MTPKFGLTGKPMTRLIHNQNIVSKTRLPSPDEVKQQFPLSAALSERILGYRTTIENILDRKDHRLIMVVGPCSIHDTEQALLYANKLKALADKVSDTIFIVMRVYFEKPRTTVGWKGLINDPHLDDTFDITTGLQQARTLLLQLTEIGLPAGTEALDPVVPQYIHDAISWTAIGARTSESQTHREMSSGISTPVGFKNGTDNNLDTAVNAIASASKPHHFLGIDQDGRCTVFHTSGNAYGHVILRGGEQPNYDSVNVALCEKALEKAKIAKNIIIDCSHGNSQKKPELQPLVLNDCVHQIIDGNASIVGMMLESHLHWGNQPLPEDLSTLKQGISITDACIDWQTTEDALLKAHELLKTVLPKRLASS